ncbi:tol-pal system protein YbgF [Stenotrophomonas ginsengisoli]|uniref:Cell division coordinator CpoB n=1 Tax=Stenotrophomonas ginsengisoli TaxID=336566 RepID=A0A0R0DM85_9GAMM|nr:tol-pal system protein YbgF [Stenotrophomonas ginsengisoli]KRG79402.1 tol-pal system protein YbgF [Stenotrophomonas ginsengisoli]
MKQRIISLMLAAAFVAAAPAQAQRASLGDRVASLEQQLLNTQANTDMLNQLQQLRSQLTEMQGTIEQLQHENEQLKQLNRAQFLDLDGRLERLEGGATAAPVAPTAAAPAAAPVPAPAAVAERAPTVRGDAGAMAATHDERTTYNVAFDALKAGRYADATQYFLSFLELYPAGVYAPNALYWLGESHYAAGQYGQARTQFEQLLAQYPTHDKAAGALLKVGLSQNAAGDVEAAQQTLQQVGQRYPGSDAAGIARDRLRSLQLGQHSLR